MRTAVLIALLACASSWGCSTYMPSVAPDQRPTGKEAIVYGRFEVSGSPAFSVDVDHRSMAVVMRCEDGREYRIRFDDQQPIVVLATAPSTCWLDEMFYLDTDNSTLGRTTLPDQVRRRMRLDAGRAYYLGDFSGTITAEFSDGFGYRFRITDVKNELSTTTRDFREGFPKLRGMTPVDAIGPMHD